MMDSPPLELIVSSALNSIGGHELDAMELDDARASFRSSLEWWPANAMSLTNLADLERERGCRAVAMANYEAAAALPLAEWADAEPADWFTAWVSEPRRECVALASASRWPRTCAH